jgi:hypothetical protein
MVTGSQPRVLVWARGSRISVESHCPTVNNAWVSYARLRTIKRRNGTLTNAMGRCARLRHGPQDSIIVLAYGMDSPQLDRNYHHHSLCVFVVGEHLGQAPTD